MSLSPCLSLSLSLLSLEKNRNKENYVIPRMILYIRKGEREGGREKKRKEGISVVW